MPVNTFPDLKEQCTVETQLKKKKNIVSSWCAFNRMRDNNKVCALTNHHIWYQQLLGMPATLQYILDKNCRRYNQNECFAQVNLQFVRWFSEKNPGFSTNLNSFGILGTLPSKYWGTVLENPTSPSGNLGDPEKRKLTKQRDVFTTNKGRKSTKCNQRGNSLDLFIMVGSKHGTWFMVIPCHGNQNMPWVCRFWKWMTISQSTRIQSNLDISR